MNKKQERLNELEAEVAQLEVSIAQLGSQSARYANVRLIVFMLAALASGAALVSWGIWPWLAITPLALTPFALSVYRHRQVDSRLRQHEIYLGLKQAHIARMMLDWANIPAPLTVAVPAGHPFALDLDLIGDHSLHQLLDTAVSLEGSQRLCNWLLDTKPDPDRIAQRQRRIQQLAQLVDFRDELYFHASLISTTSNEKWPGKRLLDWLARQHGHMSLRPALRLLWPLAFINITLGLLYALERLGPWWAATWIIYVVISFAQVRKIGPLFQEAFFVRDGLSNLSQLFNFLESYDYSGSPELQTLCQPFLDQQQRPSLLLQRVTRVVAAVALQRNQFLWLGLNALIPWDITFADQLNQHKRRLQSRLPTWLETWFELEALSSFANFVYLNPGVTFPQILNPLPDQPILYEARELGHPLISDTQRICNDFHVTQPGYIYLITGSNMAGKSTFLRTLGVNMALAYAGGPVVAQSLRLSMFRLFTAIRIADSVVDGFSYFYAEVHRLKTLLDELSQGQAPPLFYLVDEIFRGTNNRERLIGSRSYIRALAQSAGVGAIATHDLELVNLADEIPGISNYHFRDAVQDGRMIFDYKLHQGPCPTTNALKIMQQAGLPVENPAAG